MKQINLKSTAIALTVSLMATTAYAGIVDDVINDLTTQGYSKIEISNGILNLQVEATKDGVSRQITYNKLTGSVVKDAIGGGSADSSTDTADGSSDDSADGAIGGTGTDALGDSDSADAGDADAGGTSGGADAGGTGGDSGGGDSGGTGGGTGDSAMLLVPFNYVTGGHELDVKFG